jgi:hypothetical protein
MSENKDLNTGAVSGELILAVDLEKASFDDLQALTVDEAKDFAVAAYQKAASYEGKALAAVRARSTDEEKITVLQAIVDSERNSPEALRRVRERVLQWWKRGQFTLSLPEGKTFGISGEGKAGVVAGRAKRLPAPEANETPAQTAEAAAIGASQPNPEEREKSAKERLDSANAKIQEVLKENRQLRDQVAALDSDKAKMVEELIAAYQEIENLKAMNATLVAELEKATQPRRRRA